LVILTGNPGEGKTATAANLALECSSDRKHCVKLECARDWEDINWSLQCFTTVIIDDIFGGISLDHERLKDWKTVLGDLEQRAKKKELYVIITSRHYIKEEARENMDRITLFGEDSGYILRLDSLEISSGEMRLILEAVIERNGMKDTFDRNGINLDHCVRNARGVLSKRDECVFGFPECSVIFATEAIICHGSDFFLKPEGHFKGYIEQLYKAKDVEQFYKFLALVIVWAERTQKIDEGDIRNPKNVSVHFHEIADCFGIDINIQLIENIKFALDAYSNFLLLYINRSGEYTFTHNVIGEMVGVVLGGHRIVECIQLCQRDFLMERLTLSDEGEFKVTVPQRMYTALCEKFVRMMCRDGCNAKGSMSQPDLDVELFAHKAFKNEEFVNAFVTFILREDKRNY